MKYHCNKTTLLKDTLESVKVRAVRFVSVNHISLSKVWFIQYCDNVTNANHRYMLWRKWRSSYKKKKNSREMKGTLVEL